MGAKNSVRGSSGGVRWFGRVTTDHDPLIGLMRKGDICNERIMKMKMAISEFDLDVRHIPGDCNPADVWTRLGLGPETDTEEEADALVLTLHASDIA